MKYFTVLIFFMAFMSIVLATLTSSVTAASPTSNVQNELIGSSKNDTLSSVVTVVSSCVVSVSASVSGSVSTSPIIAVSACSSAVPTISHNSTTTTTTTSKIGTSFLRFFGLITDHPSSEVSIHTLSRSTFLFISITKKLFALVASILPESVAIPFKDFWGVESNAPLKIDHGVEDPASEDVVVNEFEGYGFVYETVQVASVTSTVTTTPTATTPTVTTTATSTFVASSIHSPTRSGPETSVSIYSAPEPTFFDYISTITLRFFSRIPLIMVSNLPRINTYAFKLRVKAIIRISYKRFFLYYHLFEDLALFFPLLYRIIDTFLLHRLAGALVWILSMVFRGIGKCFNVFFKVLTWSLIALGASDQPWLAFCTANPAFARFFKPVKSIFNTYLTWVRIVTNIDKLAYNAVVEEIYYFAQSKYGTKSYKIFFEPLVVRYNVTILKHTMITRTSMDLDVYLNALINGMVAPSGDLVVRKPSGEVNNFFYYSTTVKPTRTSLFGIVKSCSLPPAMELQRKLALILSPPAPRMHWFNHMLYKIIRITYVPYIEIKEYPPVEVGSVAVVLFVKPFVPIAFDTKFCATITEIEDVEEVVRELEDHQEASATFEDIQSCKAVEEVDAMVNAFQSRELSTIEEDDEIVAVEELVFVENEEEQLIMDRINSPISLPLMSPIVKAKLVIEEGEDSATDLNNLFLCLPVQSIQNRDLKIFPSTENPAPAATAIADDHKLMSWADSVALIDSDVGGSWVSVSDGDFSPRPTVTSVAALNPVSASSKHLTVSPTEDTSTAITTDFAWLEGSSVPSTPIDTDIFDLVDFSSLEGSSVPSTPTNTAAVDLVDFSSLDRSSVPSTPTNTGDHDLIDLSDFATHTVFCDLVDLSATESAADVAQSINTVVSDISLLEEHVIDFSRVYENPPMPQDAIDDISADVKLVMVDWLQRYHKRTEPRRDNRLALRHEIATSIHARSELRREIIATSGQDSIFATESVLAAATVPVSSEATVLSIAPVAVEMTASSTAAIHSIPTVDSEAPVPSTVPVAADAAIPSTSTVPSRVLVSSANPEVQLSYASALQSPATPSSSMGTPATPIPAIPVAAGRRRRRERFNNPNGVTRRTRMGAPPTSGASSVPRQLIPAPAVAAAAMSVGRRGRGKFRADA